MLHATLGDRRVARDAAPDPADARGKTIRLHDDGAIPADNPFRGRSVARSEVFKLGHRNQQGLAVHPQSGALWLHVNGKEWTPYALLTSAHGGLGLDVPKDQATRDALARADHPEALTIPGGAMKDLFKNANFRRGVATLGERGLTYDSWHYHYQNSEFLELARAVPSTTMVLDHFGTPLGVGPYESHRDEIFTQWKKDIADIAQCSNVVAKLGGLAMPDNGFGWHTAERPPTSDEFITAQQKYFDHTIECFGPDRCMFESNFPIDRFSLSYTVVWNAFKKMTASFSETEKDAMFRGTATRIYSL
jgi:predicted TIM-barrel fold metal-dependent hydrolase